MKKILLVALIALCGASFGFGRSFNDCLVDCKRIEVVKSKASKQVIEKDKIIKKCVDDCSSPAEGATQQIHPVIDTSDLSKEKAAVPTK